MFRYIDATSLIKRIDAATEFVAFDVETTGLLPGQDRITEIGAIRFTLQGSGEEFGELVDPGRPIPADASRVSGITDDMVRGKPGIKTILPRFLEFTGNAILVAHNAPFDGAFLRDSLLRCGLPLIANPLIDTRLMAKTFMPGLPGYSLQKVLESLSLARSVLHRAREDALGCRDVFLACLGRLGVGSRRTHRLKDRIAFVLAEDHVDQAVQIQ